MQITLTEALGFCGIIVSLMTMIWMILDYFQKLDGRVGQLEEKTDEILIYIRSKKKKRTHQKH